jgi:hypothetical protein
MGVKCKESFSENRHCVIDDQHTVEMYNFIYKDECLFVCMYGTYTNPHFWTDLNQTLYTYPPWSGRDRRVCMDPKFLTSSTFWVLFFFGWPLQNHEHKRAAGATVFRDTLMSEIPAGVGETSPTLRRRRRSNRRQPYIRDSSGSSPNVPEMTPWQTTESSATASHLLFRRVFGSRHGYDVQPGDGAIRHSLISLTLAPVYVTYRKSRPCRRQLRVPTPKCVALLIMRTIS